MTANRPSATDVRYDSAEEIMAYYQGFIALLQERNGVIYPLPHTRANMELVREGKQWLKGVESALDTMAASRVVPMLEAYDLMMRICWGTSVNTLTINRICDRVLAAYSCDESSVALSHVMTILRKTFAINPTGADRRWMEWYFRNIGEWCAELRRFGRLSDVSDEERYARMKILLREDLFPYLGGQAEAQKRQWSEDVRGERGRHV